MVVAQLPANPAPRVARPVSTGSIVGDVLRSEWTKLRTVRSTYWTLFVAAVLTVGLSALVCGIYTAQYAHVSLKDRATFDPISSSLVGGFLAQLPIAVLGVLVITNEYTSGMIRATLAAVPQRRTVLAAKAAVFAGVTLVVTTLSSFAAFFLGQAILSTKGIGASLGDPGALRTVVGTGLFLAVLGLLALALGTIIRRTAGAITAVVGMIFVLPVLAGLLPGSMSGVQKFLPSNAGQALVAGTARGANELSPWVGFAVFCLYAVVALVIAGAMLVGRDA
jgi:ABC-type transport system involved in multi-copper enzyme maturation permease subunit